MDETGKGRKKKGSVAGAEIFLIHLLNEREWMLHVPINNNLYEVVWQNETTK